MISVIIPLYNVERYVISSLKSAFNQTYKDIEYILVDDCSTDNTMQVVMNYIDNLKENVNIQIIHHEKNRGLSVARNTGLSKATGDYVYFMDSDDEITPDCIEKHYNAIIGTNADFTVANVELKGKKRRSIHIKQIPRSVMFQRPLESYFSRMWSVSAWNKLYKKDFLIRNSLIFQSGLLFEDILWSYFVAKYAEKLVLVESATYQYLVRSNSITTHKNKAKKIDSLLFIIQTIYEDMKNGDNVLFNDGDIKLVFRFLNFLRFNAAIGLLNYVDNFNESRNYYLRLKKVLRYAPVDLYSVLLMMPYEMFYFLLKPIYFLYKKYQ